MAHATETGGVPSFSANYQVKYGLLRGKMTLELERRDSAYVYETSLSPAGLVTLFKRGTITESTTLIDAGGTLRPIDYYSRDTIANPERITTYQFDYDSGRVTGQYKSQEIDEPMRADGQNRISGQVAIMVALQSGTEISNFSVFDRGRWKDYQLEITRDQTVKTHAGTFDTVEVSYSSSDKDRRWSTHFATHLGYMPVMVVFYEDGKLKSRAQLTDYEIEGVEYSHQE